MQKPTLDISVKLVSENPNNVVITDNTNYTALGLDPLKVKINARVYTPVGLMYSPAYYNTPGTNNDFTPAVPFDYITLSDDGAIPDILLDNKGCFISGIYKVELKWYYVDTEETFDYTFEENVKFIAPAIKIEQLSDCFCPKFRSTDMTDYGASEEIEYAHKINYPAETDENDIVVTLLDYTDSRLANGTYVTEIVTKRVFPVVGVFSVEKEIKGKKSHTVDCKSVCDIKCGINNLYEKYKAACGSDKTESDRLSKLLSRAAVLYTLIFMNNGCGDTSKSDSYLTQLKAIIGDCDCGCKDCGDDVWVVGACGSSGTSEFDPSGIYTYIDNINTNLTNLINDFGDDIQNLTTLIGQLANKSWFEGLDTDCLVGFPGAGSEEDKKQHIIDLLCDLKDSLSLDPVAQNDISTTVEDVAVEKLVTLNDFFQTDATVTITTAPSNGTAVVLGDDKTLKYTPGAGWTGTDTVGYTLTDSNGNTSTAVWTIIVSAVPAASCSTVVALFNASLTTVGANLQITLANQSDYGANTPTSESYLIQIRDSSNVVLSSYTATGSTTSDPTIWTSPIPFAANWNNVNITLTTASQSATGDVCGTVTSTVNYSLADISVSWFDGLAIPDCIPIVGGDNEIQKKQKLLDAICNAGGGLAKNGISGTGTALDKFKLGGELTEDTLIDGDGYKMEVIDAKIHSVRSGGAASVGTAAKRESIHEVQNFNAPNGYAIHYDRTVSNIDAYPLTNGYAIMNKSTSHLFVLKSDVTTAQLKKGSAVSNAIDFMQIDSSGGSYSLSQEQGSGTHTRRVVSNRRIQTFLHPIGLSTKATVGKFANLEVICTAQAYNNTFNEFIQVFVRSAKGTGSVQASGADMPLTYGIYQEDDEDKNVFYGEIEYHGALTNASDIRSKDVVGAYQAGLEQVKALNPILFTKKEGFGKQGVTFAGIVAQELEQVIPQAVSTGKVETMNGEIIEDFKTVDTSYIIFSLVNAVKELSAKCDSLQAQLDAKP